jgi:predicted AAA+ superfamily ATPase
VSETKISRYYNKLESYCFPGKVLVIFGPRQAGKTTLLKQYLQSCPHRYRLDSGDNVLLQELLRTADFKTIFDYVSGYELIAIDEAQMIPNIGQVLKITCLCSLLP